MRDPNITYTAGLVRAIAEIDEFKGRWRVFADRSDPRLESLRRIATIESVGSSTRIEGAALSDAEVDALLSGLDVTSFASRDEQEVAGYADAMRLVFESAKELTLTGGHVLQLHKVLLRHSEKDAWHRGKYKSMPNHVAAFDEAGREVGILFETASPLETPARMEALLTWTNRANDGGDLHPLLVIAAFVVTFLEIHPFQDGNGRLSRILTTLLLLRAGYAYVPFASLERIVEERKGLYYSALRRTQTTMRDESPDWEPWIRFFFACLVEQKRRLEEQLGQLDQRAPTTTQEPDLHPLSARVIELLVRDGRLSISELVEATGANRNTIKVRLRELVDAGRVQRHGRGRGTWYALG